MRREKGSRAFVRLFRCLGNIVSRTRVIGKSVAGTRVNMDLHLWKISLGGGQHLCRDMTVRIAPMALNRDP